MPARTPTLEADIKAEVRDFVKQQIEAAATESKTDAGEMCRWLEVREIRSGRCAVQPPATSSAINALTTVGRAGWMVSAGANLEVRLWFGATPSPEQVQQQLDQWKAAARAK